MKTLRDLVIIQSLVSDIYQEGVIGIDESRIHLDNDAFDKLSVDQEVSLEETWSHAYAEMSMVVDKVIFMTLIKRD